MNAIQTIVVALAGAILFDRLGVPSGSLIGALVGVAAINLAGRTTVALPHSGQFLAFAALGWAIGHSVTRETVSALQRAAVPLLAVVVVLIVCGGVLALVLTRLGYMDGTTAFLAASPGALSQMSALATGLKADAALVAAVHTVRVIAVILIAPVIVRMIPSGT